MTNFASDLSFFTVLAQAPNLSAAAIELDISTAAVSKRLSQLEASLGVALLERGARQSRLTDAGRRLLAGSHTVLASLDELRAEVSNPASAPRGRLRINATLGFGRKYIASVVERYTSKFPLVDVQLLLSDFPLNLQSGAVDLCIWLDALPEARQIARTIAPCRRLVVATPSYWAKHGMPSHPSQLAEHRCLLLRQTDQSYATWRFTRGKTTESVRVRGQLATNDGEVLKHWCMKHRGVMLRSEWDIADELRSGLLKVALSDYIAPSSDVVAWYLPGQESANKVKSFLEMLSESLGKTPPWQR